MTSRMRLGLASVALLFASVAALIAADFAPQLHARVTAQPVDFTVHEWGTFTSVAGEDGSAIEWDALGCKDDLPEFVHDFGYRGFKWSLQGTVRMETPVMYFYSPRAVQARVKVEFPKGLITEWYPQAEYEVYQTSGEDQSLRRLATNLFGIDTSLRSVTGAIEWNDIKVQPDTAPSLPLENGPSRYYAARETDAAPITVGGEHEKFLFYRGVGRFAIPLSARLSVDGKVVVENRGVDTVPSVILFENRGGRLGYRNAGAVKATKTLERPALDDSLTQLKYDLENALVEQGLFLKEAQAMVETWRDSWFEEGARLIYIMPSPLVDAILPLQVQPAPSQIARAFVGRIELVTAETIRSVEQALATNDSSTLDRYRRFLGPIRQRIERGRLERANQVDELLRRSDQSISAQACR